MSRKIGVGSSQIVDFLSAQNITIEGGTNIRIEQAHELMILTHFAPHLLIEEKEIEPASLPANGVTEEVEIEVQPIVEVVESDPEVADDAIISQDDYAVEILTEQKTDLHLDKMGVIKASKVELPGLKVVGKIELPQPKLKEVIATEQKEITEPEKVDRQEKLIVEPILQKETTVRRPPPTHQRRQQDRPIKNPIALQREREAREADEMRKAELQRQKEARTNYYQKRIKPVAPTKAYKIVDEPLENLSTDVVEEPKSVWGKFIKWLTS